MSMIQVEYSKLDYDRKLLYVRSVFEEAQEAHPVYKKLHALLSGERQIEETYLDQLYDQVQSVLDNVANASALEKMSRLARKIANIRKREAADRKQELSEIAQMERDIMQIEDDKPSPLLPR